MAITLEVDWNNNGQFDHAESDITSRCYSVETLTGRDYNAQVIGRASAGRLGALLDNRDGFFSPFNTSSPISGLALPSRRVRLRDSVSPHPDPVWVLRDTFRRTPQAFLGLTQESPIGPAGAFAWTESGGTDPWAIDVSNFVEGEVFCARPANFNENAIGVVTSGLADYYAQVRVGRGVFGAAESVINSLTMTTIAGVVFRYVDANNYQRAALNFNQNRLELTRVVGGTPTINATVPFDLDTMRSVGYGDGMVIGVNVVGGVVDVFIDGVAVLSGEVALNTSAQGVGIIGRWLSGQPNSPPVFNDFDLFQPRVPNTAGVLWTGKIRTPIVSTTPGPLSIATMDAIGPLDDLQIDIFPPFTVGRKTGYLVGRCLDLAGVRPPPSKIDQGVVTTALVDFGRFGKMAAMSAIRRFEEMELGFLFETQEGYLSFDQRDARDSRTSEATFSDAPGMGELAYDAITEESWLGRIFNYIRVPVVDGVDTEWVIRQDQLSMNNYGFRPFPIPAEGWADTADAAIYAEEIIALFKDRSPHIVMDYAATKSAGHLAQALARRVGDKITVTATGNAKLGFSQDFFIEGIRHSIRAKEHQVQYTLSPVVT